MLPVVPGHPPEEPAEVFVLHLQSGVQMDLFKLILQAGQADKPLPEREPGRADIGRHLPAGSQPRLKFRPADDRFPKKVRGPAHIILPRPDDPGMVFLPAEPVQLFRHAGIGGQAGNKP